MKLETNHIAPYLPYHINLYDVVSNNVVPLSALSIDEEMLAFDTEYSELEWGNITAFKLILKPLSDYTVCHGSNVSELGGDMSDEFEIYQYATHSKSLASIPYSAYELMIRSHVDVFNLIPAGLAIDLNTLNHV